MESKTRWTVLLFFAFIVLNIAFVFATAKHYSDENKNIEAQLSIKRAELKAHELKYEEDTAYYKQAIRDMQYMQDSLISVILEYELKDIQES